MLAQLPISEATAEVLCYTGYYYGCRKKVSAFSFCFVVVVCRCYYVLHSYSASSRHIVVVVVVVVLLSL